MNDSAAAVNAVRDTLIAIRDTGPEALLEFVTFRLRKTGLSLTEAELINLVTAPDLGGEPRKSMHMAISQWDADTGVAWAAATDPWTSERRIRIFDLLELSGEARARLDEAYPSIAKRDTMIADPGDWEPWYDEDRRREHDFYWRAYRGVLEAKNWDPEAIAALNKSAVDVVGRLADPAGDASYPTKGLVVGHVQSGKTANFTGIIAKAIDSGYRLVIVLTGTIELLRGQTQRRLDMELVGEENILEGRDRKDADAIRNVDYIGNDDADWVAGKFLRHGIDIHSSLDIPAIKRLTFLGKDYRQLKAGLDALDFRRTGELRNPAKPVYDLENIYSVDARLAVVKKNTTALKNLLRDLQDVRADLREIPVLIIDDEADQASVNTINPNSKQAKKDQKKRSAINALINDLLSKMPRAQYIGYTATPFANVFISPDDSQDIFPKDFIVSLTPSSEYMGGTKFHDLGGLEDYERGDPAFSNEAAHVRDLRAADDESERAEIRDALDAFVLTGAIKKWRQANDETLTFRHHTMLVHESVRVAEHADLAGAFRSVWEQAGYSTPSGLARLRSLYMSDFLVVHNSRAAWNGLPMPDRFDDLKTFIGATIDAIMVAGDPVVVVNGSSDSDYNAMDFMTQPYWRVMVGGAKLSRGFTVEGLTVSYYRRRATAADTLMQMGRWFGYRAGHQDLVRLYIGRDVLDGQNKSYDLYDAFTSIIEDEEEFRAQLHKFSELREDGKPVVRPIHVPPMVFQQLPWLRPTGRNKMYNAVLKYEGEGGEVKDFNAHDYRSDGSRNAAHFKAVAKWLEGLDARPEEFRGVSGTRFTARTRVLSTVQVLDALRSFELLAKDQLLPTIAMIEKAVSESTLTDWLLVVPYLGDDRVREVEGVPVPLIARRRRADRPGFSGSERRHRGVLEHVTGKKDAMDAGPVAARLASPTRGALLLTFTIDPVMLDEEKDAGRAEASRVALPPLGELVSANDVATLLSLALPYESAPRGRVGFGVRREDLQDEAIIPKDA
ncbi:Z1 domain-containing protein [Cryobacterium sp. TMT1-66-1]|uniref:Z1 domain-containing protein n=1 Tax=Cryobacterium sp. TMT1-66-1 TaxID=1259242 RepID=UPI00106B775C|nr:Z1 domain-containing protein [Cryobacterium sp. TMT1-66-1]TFD05533.1 hypothetical protein E3T29_12785 [Cryobacterium sp. TMT1-66-1]